MSEAASALPGAEARGIVTIREAGLRGMITLRGDLGSQVLQDAACDVAGVGFPGQGAAIIEGARGICWMSPDEVLILVPHGEAVAAVATLTKALAGEHHLAVNVSDARAMFALEGESAVIREVLAKLTPADLRASAFQVGRIRRTRLAQVPAALWFTGEGRAEVVCFRSVAAYVFGLLEQATKPGSEVGYF